MAFNDNRFRAAFETQRSLAFGSIVAGYTAIGSGLANPASLVIVQNLTDQLLQFSMVRAGETPADHFPLSAGDKLILDVRTNALLEEIGTTFYVKRIGTPTTGNVYVSVIYGR